MTHPVVELLKSLMSVVSTTEYEYEIGVWLEQYLQKLGYTVDRIPISPGSSRHNVHAYLGSARKTRVLLTSHMDTIFAVEELRKEKKLQAEGDVGLLFVVGEENGGPGMIAANEMGLTWESIIFAEPTECKLAKGHKGQVAFELIAEGIACHSGYPELGKSAISALLSSINDLASARWPKSDLLGASTFNIGTVEGGVKHNVVAPSAKALCEVRMVADLSGVKAQIADIVSKHSDVTLKFVFEYPEALLDWEIEGFDAMPVAFGTDVPRLGGNHKKVLYGPGSILTAHGPDERIEISQLVESIDAYKELVLHFLSWVLQRAQTSYNVLISAQKL